MAGERSSASLRIWRHGCRAGQPGQALSMGELCARCRTLKGARARPQSCPTTGAMTPGTSWPPSGLQEVDHRQEPDRAGVWLDQTGKTGESAQVRPWGTGGVASHNRPPGQTGLPIGAHDGLERPIRRGRAWIGCCFSRFLRRVRSPRPPSRTGTSPKNEKTG